jgi:cathepsin L
MKSAIILLALALTASAVSIFNEKLDGEWVLFKAQHNKVYQHEKEETMRRLIWEKNLALINEHNVKADGGEHTFWLGMNKFGDMTSEEFSAKVNGFKKPANKNRTNIYVPEKIKIPDSVDWRTQGYVTPVQDQGQCGSCWAFSALDALTGQHFKKTQKLITLSVQNLMDCTFSYGNQGCCGGLMDASFTYIKDNNGIDTDASYPYEAQDGKCRFKPNNVGAVDTGFVDIQANSEADLQNALATIGPISVAFDAGQSSFQFYTKGIYYDKACSATNLNHASAAVGYGTLGPNQDYYIVKNSWGVNWGDQGYILMSRNRDNNCGIASMAIYPTV